jgi:hypothetical protein
MHYGGALLLPNGAFRVGLSVDANPAAAKKKRETVVAVFLSA